MPRWPRHAGGDVPAVARERVAVGDGREHYDDVIVPGGGAVRGHAGERPRLQRGRARVLHGRDRHPHDALRTTREGRGGARRLLQRVYREPRRGRRERGRGRGRRPGGVAAPTRPRLEGPAPGAHAAPAPTPGATHGRAAGDVRRL